MHVRQISHLLLLVCLTTGQMMAQFAIGPDLIRPGGRFGRIFEQGIGLTVEYSPANEIAGRTASYFGRIYRLTAHQDTLRSTYSRDPFTRAFGPGFETYSPAIYGELGVQGTWRLYPDRDFSPIALASGQGFYSIYEKSSVVPGISTNSLGGESGAGATLSVGAIYEVSRAIGLRLLLGHTFQFGSEYGYTRHWRMGLVGMYYW